MKQDQDYFYDDIAASRREANIELAKRSVKSIPNNRKGIRTIKEVASDLEKKASSILPESIRRKELYVIERKKLESETIEETINRKKAAILNKKVIKRAVKKRRSEFNKIRPQRLLQMIDAGIDYCCAIPGCMDDDLAIDHIVPIYRGGGDELENLQFLCRKHNAEKGKK